MMNQQEAASLQRRAMLRTGIEQQMTRLLRKCGEPERGQTTS